MNIVIVEDEPLAAIALEDLLCELRPKIQVVASLSSVEEAIHWFSFHSSPDLVFCDIHLSDGNSFEIFNQVEVKSPVVFTTAYDQYAIQAFQVNSLDYLLKPITTEAVAQSLKKHETLNRQYVAPGWVNIQEMVKPGRSRFLVKVGQTFKSVIVEEVAYFLAEETVVFLVTREGKKHIINYTLDYLENQLDITTFFRINRHCLVHIKSVVEAHPYFKGRLSILLSTEAEMIVSSSRASAFKRWLDA